MPEKYKLATQDTGKAEEAEPVSSYDTGKIKEAEPVFSCRTLLAGTTDEPVLEGLIDLSDRSTYEMENILNKRRLRQFKENYTKELLRILCEQDFEYGFDSSADLFVRELMGQNETITKEWLNSVYIEHYHDMRVVIGLLQVISHLQYLDIFPQGPTMALAALVHANSEVRECGIRAFENWSTIESLNILRTVKYDEIWLQDYLNQVIRDLEEEFE
jgi:hypothetical protein